MKALYFNAKLLTEAAVEAEILTSVTKEKREYILVCCYGLDGQQRWVWEDKEMFCNSLMESVEEQDLILEALVESNKELPKFYVPYKCNNCSAAEYSKEGLHRCKQDFNACRF